MASILLLEDDAQLRETLEDVLSDKYEVKACEAPEQALQLAQQQTFDLLLSDVRLGGPVDGVEVLRQVRERQPHLRCLIMTGFADLEVPVRASQLQADDYLTKPFLLTQLFQSLEQILNLPDKSETHWLLQIAHKPADFLKRRLWDKHLQQLQQVRQRLLQRFFILIRSGRISVEASYSVFVQLLAAESQYHRAQPEDWANLSKRFEALEGALLAALTGANSLKPAPELSWENFKLMHQRVLQGEVQLAHFMRAAQLCVQSEARRADLESYLTYQLLWGSREESEQGWIGHWVGHYQLTRCLPASSTQSRLFEATSRQGQAGFLVVALPKDSPSLASLLPAAGERYLGQLKEHHCLLYALSDTSFYQRIPQAGLSPRAAWQLLRPVFAAVYLKHKEGVFSGSFSLEQVVCYPGQAYQLIGFGPETMQAHKKSDGTQLMLLNRARLFRSLFWEGAILEPQLDMPMLAYAFLEVLHNPETGKRDLSEHCLDFTQDPSSKPFPYAPLDPVLRRMCSLQREQRPGDLAGLARHLDQLLA